MLPYNTISYRIIAVVRTQTSVAEDNIRITAGRNSIRPVPEHNANARPGILLYNNYCFTFFFVLSSTVIIILSAYRRYEPVVVASVLYRRPCSDRRHTRARPTLYARPCRVLQSPQNIFRFLSLNFDSAIFSRTDNNEIIITKDRFLRAPLSES